MKQSFISLCSEFTKRVRYNFALLQDVPNKHIMKELAKDGYKVVPYIVSDDEIRAAASAGHAALYLPTQTVKNHYGIDVIRDDGVAHDQFRQDVRRAAARVYGITP